MSEKIKGSDGIERTLSEWEDFIACKMVDADGDTDRDLALGDLQQEARHTLENGEESEYLDAVAGEWFRQAFRDAIGKGQSYEGRMEHLKTNIEKLSRSIGRKVKKKAQTSALGLEIIYYLLEHGDLPRDRGTLMASIDARGEHKIPLTSLKDNLPWYHLEKVCSTYHKD